MPQDNSAPRSRLPLLPVTGAALSSTPGALAAVREVGARHGMDYTDDAAVDVFLRERRAVLRRGERGAGTWFGALFLVAGIVWLLLGPAVPALAGNPALTYGPAGPLLIFAVALLARVVVRWRRELRHPALAGYREVLGIARAYGITVTHVPDWLVGRTQSGSRESTPIPEHIPHIQTPTPTPAPTQAPAQAPAPAQAQAPGQEQRPVQGPLQVPAKPAAVAAYEEMEASTTDDWHTEGGCLLVLAGIGGGIWAFTADAPIGCAGVVLVAFGVMAWVAGGRRGAEKQRLREAALTYVRALSAAQAAGAQVPELSLPLRELLESGNSAKD